MSLLLALGWTLAHAAEPAALAPAPVDTAPTLAPTRVRPQLDALPVLAWSARLAGPPGPGAGRSEPAAPVAYGDRIFVGRSGVEGLLVLDRRDGSLLQTLPAKAPVLCAPVIADGWIWFADASGTVQAYKLDALDLATPAWTHFGGAPVVSAPVRVGDKLLVTNVDDRAYVLDLRTGALAWRYQHKVEASRGGSMQLFGAPAAWADPSRNLALVGESDGLLVALDLDDGEPRDTLPTGTGAYPDLIAPAMLVTEAGASPLVVAGGFSGPLQAVNYETRAPAWRLDIGSASPWTRVDGTIYHGGTDGKLRRIDARTGAVAWTWDSGDDGTLTTPIWTAQGLLVASAEGTLRIVDADAGTTRWTFEVDDVDSHGFSAAPFVDGDTIYALSNGGVLYALHAPAPTPARTIDPWVSSN